MLQSNQIKEQLSLAYLIAVAAKCGFSTEFNRVDYDSIDATIKCNGRLQEDSTLYSPEIQIQLKATSSPRMTKEVLKFPLSVKNYNDLRARTITPRLLVVMILPPEEDQWLKCSEEELSMKKCAYFICLKNYPDRDNTTSITINLPLSNLFTPNAVLELMTKTSKQEEL